MSEEHLVNLPAYPTSSSACSSLGAAPPALLPRHRCHSCSTRRGCSTYLALRPAKVRRAGHIPPPKTVCAEISVWDGVRGTPPLCPAHPESAMYIYVFAHIPSPSFLLSLAIFSLALYFFFCQPPLLLCENKHCTVTNSYLHALAKTQGAGRLDKTNGLFSAVSYL